MIHGFAWHGPCGKDFAVELGACGKINSKVAADLAPHPMK
jgi:hypothetical protein